MSEFEQNADALEALIAEHTLTPDPKFTEADTRAQIIDRILQQVLGWPTKSFRREEHVHEGYIDYTMQAGVNRLVIEAKRVGKPFVLPISVQFEKAFTVKNLLKKQRDLLLMYDQVTRYAHERGIGFCVLTNGTQWLAFPGVRTDAIHLRQSRVIAFNGLKSIHDNFLEFWNLLSYEAVQKGSLSEQLTPEVISLEPSFVFNGEGRVNVPYDRNHLALPLMDVLPKYFGDLHGDPRKSEMLRECFVQDQPVREGLRGLLAEPDAEEPSRTLTAASPVLHFYALPKVSEKLDSLINAFIADNRDTYFQVILGRVGIGKTTFLAHFFEVDKERLLKEHYVIRLDLQQTTEFTDLDTFFDEIAWEGLSAHTRFGALVAPVTLRKIFARDVSLAENGPLSRLKLRDPERFEDEIAALLTQRLQERRGFVRALAKYLHEDQSGRFILVFDNVDQLDAELQERVIRFAFAKMKEYRAFTILSMWEETYFSSKGSGRTLSTMRTVPMMITRQSITSVLVKRLKYLIEKIESGEEKLALLPETGCDRTTFARFVELVLESLLVENRRVRTFLEVVGLGNIRRALELFAAFLTAGSLETRKITELMQSHEDYRVPVHEFIKSVMLGSKRYYAERTSDILNIFAVGDVESPSHFTRLRILQWLYERRHEASPFGTGLMTNEAVVAYFRQIGTSNKDVDVSIRRLTEGGLVENDIRARKQLERAQALKITASGRYYLISLRHMFPYLDLVMQDTPFFDKEVFDKIHDLCDSTRMSDRVDRCHRFLDYLGDQEDEEILAISKLDSATTWRRKFVPSMNSAIDHTEKQLREKGVL